MSRLLFEFFAAEATQAYRSVAARLHLWVQNVRDARARLRLWATGTRDVPSRFVLTDAISFDASSASAAGTGTLSWTHTPVSPPKGILILIAQNVGTTDEVTAVTYGGLALTPVPNSPVLHVQGTEDGTLYGYFRGSGLPTGPQTVAVTVNGTGSSKRAVAISVRAIADVSVDATALLDVAAATNPSVTLITSSSTSTVVAGVLHSGQGAVTGIGPGAAYADLLEHDYGAQTASWIRRPINGAGGNVLVDWLAGSATAGILAVALRDAAATGYRDASARVRLSLPGWADASARFRIGIRAFRDTASRVGLHVQGYRDTAARLRLRGIGYRDTASRFRLQGPAWRDVSARFVLVPSSLQAAVAFHQATRALTTEDNRTHALTTEQAMSHSFPASADDRTAAVTTGHDAIRLLTLPS